MVLTRPRHAIIFVDGTGGWLSFRQSFLFWFKSESFLWLAGLTISALLQAHALQREPGRSDLYHFCLGSKELFLVPLSPLFFILTVAIVALLACLAELVMLAVARLLAPLARGLRP